MFQFTKTNFDYNRKKTKITMDSIIRFLLALNLFQTASDHYKQSKENKKYDEFYKQQNYVDVEEYQNPETAKSKGLIIKNTILGLLLIVALGALGSAIFANANGYFPWESKTNIAYDKADNEMAMMIDENVKTYIDNTQTAQDDSTINMNQPEQEFENKILSIGISPNKLSDIKESNDKDALSEIKTEQFNKLSSQNKMALIKNLESQNTAIANLLKSQNKTGHIIIDKEPDYQSHIDAYNNQKDIFNNALNNPKTKARTSKISTTPLPNY